MAFLVGSKTVIDSQGIVQPLAGSNSGKNLLVGLSHTNSYGNGCGCCNMFIGECVADSNGNANVCWNHVIGNGAGRYLCSNNNFVAGLAAAQESRGLAGLTVIGNSAFKFGCGSGFWGGSNTLIGGCAGIYIATSGASLSAPGQYNVAVGPYAMAGESSGGTTGSCNIAIGSCTLWKTTSGCMNTAVGACAGNCITSGCCNVFIGYSAGGNCITTGSNNIDIGWYSLSSNGFYNLSGSSISTSTCNTIHMGNCNHSNACIRISWSVVSDIRYKCVWGNVTKGKSFLNSITPIEYSFKDRYTEELTDNIRRYGFSAQEILELEGDDNVIVSNNNPESLGLTSDYLIPIIVNAIKELSAENQALLARVEALESA